MGSDTLVSLIICTTMYHTVLWIQCKGVFCYFYKEYIFQIFFGSCKMYFKFLYRIKITKFYAKIVTLKGNDSKQVVTALSPNS